MPDEAAAARNSIGHTLRVAVAVSLVCSVVVATAAVMLEPLQQRNEALNRQRNILEVANLLEPGGDVATLYAQVQPRVIELASGAYSDALEPGFDVLAAARDPDLGVDVPADLDLGNIGQRPRYATVYLVGDDQRPSQIILPFYGAGLWGRIRGFISLRPDGDTIAGITFYEHAETPGLGAEIDTPRWRALWEGKQVYGPGGEPRIEVVKGSVQPGSAQAPYQVDGLAGATLTGRGVTRMLHYWLGEHGYGPYLARVTGGGTTTGV